jgi:sodium/hydrogen exchanger 8
MIPRKFCFNFNSISSLQMRFLFVLLLFVCGSFAGDDVYTKCDTELGCEQKTSWTLVLIITILMLCVLVIYGLNYNKLARIPESLVVILLGVAIGFYLQATPGILVSSLVGFNTEVFFLFILPPIIFEQGFALQKGDFFKNIGSILVFAFAGTVISTMVVGFGLYLLGWHQIVTPVRKKYYGRGRGKGRGLQSFHTSLSHTHTHSLSLPTQLPLIDCFIFGSLISAIDPVATLAIFQSLGVGATLHSLVFGESILNDAVSIVLYRTFTQAYEETGAIETWTAAGETLSSFVWVSLGSVGVGVAVGVFSALFFKHSSMREFVSLELSMMFILAYLPYLLASCFDLSGLMAVLFSGIVMSHYTQHNLSPSTQLASSQLFRMIAFLGETCCFVILGIQSMAFNGDYDFVMIFWVLVLCLLGRACNVFPLAWIMNKFRRVKIDFRMQFFMWFAGLRGAIAFALSYTIPTKAKVCLLSFLWILLLISYYRQFYLQQQWELF